MELITGRKAVGETHDEETFHLVTWFRKMLIQKDTFREAIDRSVELDDDTLASISTVAELAGHCSARERDQRPRMSHVVNVLSSLAECWKPPVLNFNGTHVPDFGMTLPESLENRLEGESIADNTDAYDRRFTHAAASVANLNEDQLVEMVARSDLKEVLKACGQAVAEGGSPTAAGLMLILEKMVSVSGGPMQRLGAYMLEGLRARLESSGSIFYKALWWQEVTCSKLMSCMTFLYMTCPYWKFAYTSANAVIKEATENESRIHIIDFQIVQGTQWMYLMEDLAKHPGRRPLVSITGIDDSQSNHARGGGLHIVGDRLAKFARERNIPFVFHDASMSGCEVQVKHLRVQRGEAVVVNFPKVVTLVEQESNTNTSPFLLRYNETLDYYTALFESIDASTHPRDDKQRISVEQHCVARDVVNMIACEGAERVKRHELLGKWRSRLLMAGFSQCPLSS